MIGSDIVTNAAAYLLSLLCVFAMYESILLITAFNSPCKAFK